VRVAGQMQQRDGYTKDLQDGSYLDGRNYDAWRVGVMFRPTDDFENYLVYDGYWQDSHGASDQLALINPKFPLIGLSGNFTPVALNSPSCVFTVTLAASGNGAPPGGCGIGYFAAFPTLPALLAEQQALGPRTILGSASSEIGKDYFYGFTDIATWYISDNLSLKNIAAARIFKQLGADDFSSTGLPLAIFGFPGNNHGWNNNEGQYTDELQLSGQAIHDRLDWRVGGFLLFDHPLGYSTVPLVGLGSTIWNHYHEETRSQALFAHGIYDLSDWIEGLHFTAGYRYTWDYDSLGERSTQSVDAVTRNAAGIATDCNIAIHDNNCFTQLDSHFSSYGWNLGLDYQWTKQTLLYVRAGNAYRPGGMILAVPPPYDRYAP
jgi:iron complex outermembrane receptor protein